MTRQGDHDEEQARPQGMWLAGEDAVFEHRAKADRRDLSLPSEFREALESGGIGAALDVIRAGRDVAREGESETSASRLPD
jgi:hypothetical protein